MAYLTRDDLKRVPIKTESARAQHYQRKTASVQTTIFLSHSHKDADIVNQAVEVLGKQGIHIYVDWRDGSMPAVTSPITAERIKGRIAECEKFVLLATNNALASRWVPWELGIADVEDGKRKIAILPVEDPPHRWTGNEYVGVYDRIERIGSHFMVIEPGKQTGIGLEEWIKRK